MGNVKKSSKKRDQALHDATHGQFGEEPRPEPLPDDRGEWDSSNDNSKIVYSQQGRNQEVFKSSFVIALDAPYSAIAMCVDDYC